MSQPFAPAPSDALQTSQDHTVLRSIIRARPIPAVAPQPGAGRVALVTDGEQRAALAVVRSLGQQGFRVVVCSSRLLSLAGGSRYCASEALISDPLDDPQLFGQEVCDLARRCKADVVIPISEPALLAILPVRESLGAARLPFADLATFRRISDKAGLLAAAPACGIAIPAQRIVHDRAAALAACDEGLEYPVVLKPARSVGEQDGQRHKVGVRYATNADDFRRRIAEYGAAAFPLLLQRRIVGPGIGVFVLMWDGKVLAAFSHRRLREKPPSGGVSVYRESHPLDPELLERSRALLAEFGWQGVAMVEYKLDAATGTPYLMEVNGRFWGSLQLAIDAGVDFPALLVAAALGQPCAESPSYRLGIRSRWWWGDVDQLFLRMRRHPSTLPPDAPTLGKAMREFLRLWRPGDCNEILRWNDPVPFFRETADWLRRT